MKALHPDWVHQMIFLHYNVQLHQRRSTQVVQIIIFYIMNNCADVVNT